MSFLRLKQHTGNNCNWKTVRQDFSGVYAYVWEKLYKKTIRICNEFGQKMAKTLFMSRVSSHLIKPDLDSACQLSSLTSRNPAVDTYALDLFKMLICNSPIWLACLWRLCKTDHCEHQQRNEWLDNVHFLQQKKSWNWWSTTSGWSGRSLSPRNICFNIVHTWGSANANLRNKVGILSPKVISPFQM